MVARHVLLDGVFQFRERYPLRLLQAMQKCSSPHFLTDVFPRSGSSILVAILLIYRSRAEC